MVNALIKLGENTNRVLNIVKARYGLKDKGEAIELVVSKYIETENDPGILPEFVEKIKQVEKQKSIKVNNFMERYRLN